MLFRSPLIISIDTEGNNLFENNKEIYKESMEKEMAELSKKLKYMNY